MAHRLVEADVRLITDFLRTNLPAELLAVATMWADGVSIPAPASGSYFPHDIPVTGLKPPCVAVVADEGDFRLGEAEANFICARFRINVAAVVQEKEAPRLSYAAYRYQAALHNLLQGKPITGYPDVALEPTVKIICKVERCSFSRMYFSGQNPADPQGVFQKEVLLEVDVEHYEKRS